MLGLSNAEWDFGSGEQEGVGKYIEVCCGNVLKSGHFEGGVGGDIKTH
jgi:hypothetical protein